ncbi:D-alanyl-D-alanine dipeptidase [Evansella tamaricis]|uniref:D-alanyl-D-alanine dipeptidase n=1 Tax=Evansella tamaricis TaxID=2069301 RepID=A0ABS6JHA0_9BACI|nr:D-alanyl-D-alanine dipeptidase [Evansella tamaricis]MBU9713059.1 D-alanyl-D-alanine dipeptidase [Evansella tamaricis]
MNKNTKPFFILVLLLFYPFLSGCFQSDITMEEHLDELEELKIKMSEFEYENAILEETISSLEDTTGLLEKEKNRLLGTTAKMEVENKKLVAKLEKMENQRITQLMDETGLVNLKDIDDTIIIDLPYATTNNFVGEKVYSIELCLLQLETALKLKAANELAKQDGLKIKIWDGYRPHDVQKVFWELTPDPSYVGDPALGSDHNRGTAVDVTLVDQDGNELEMPTRFDDFSPNAWRNYQSNTPEAQKNMEYLTKIMVESGFTTINTEWWHFADSNAKNYPVLNIPLEDFVPDLDF